MRGLPIVHVAGTKGKGSTVTMVAGVLQRRAYKTGLFSFAAPGGDRRTLSSECPPLPWRATALPLVERLRPIVEQMDREAAAEGSLGPTYFELATAIALMHFAEEKVDIAVLEVGLGRSARFDQCVPAGRHGDHQHQPRPYQATRQHRRRDCCGEGGDH